MLWDWSYAARIPGELLPGLWISLQASAGAAAIALSLGLAWAVIRYFRVPVLDQALIVVLEFIRDTPLLIQLFFLFYVLPNYGVSFPPLLTGIIGMGLYFSTYTAEVYRGALLAIPAGQWEAAKAIGLTTSRTWSSVILPQAVRLVIPPLGTYTLWLFKESAILSTITVSELLSRAVSIGTDSYRYLEPMTIAGILYLIISYPTARLIRRLEARLA